MRLRELELDEFRSFRRLRLSLDAAGFRAIGPNASGKSTLLEAISMLATTRSPRTSSEREIANWASGADLGLPPYARVRGEFERLDGRHSVEFGLSVEERGPRSLKKQVRVDDQPARAVDAVGKLKAVLFSPEDVTLVAGPPLSRRRYLDIATGQASEVYLRALSRFGRVLEQRNSLLRAFARERGPISPAQSAQELAFWDAELTALAAEVLAMRIGAMSALSTRAREHFCQLTGDQTLELRYAAHRLQLPGPGESAGFWGTPTTTYRQSIAAVFAEALATNRREELGRGVTAIGPHRDDVQFIAKGVDLAKFGSRGEQRLAVIAAKLAELDLLEESAGEPPVLLLDDVLSELDPEHRANIVATISARHAQICITATHEADLGAETLERLPTLRLSGGAISIENS